MAPLHSSLGHEQERLAKEGMEISDWRDLEIEPVPREHIAYEPYLKIRRAHKHFIVLQNRLREFGESDFYSVTTETEPGTGRHFLRVTLQPFPEDIPLIVGDLIHCLRTSLDILWNTMIRRLGGDDTRTHFPIREKRKELEGTLLKGDSVVIKSVPGVAELLINKAKIYKTGNPKGSTGLWFLNCLEKADKHRLIIPAVNATGFAGISMEDKNYNFINLGPRVFPAGATDLKDGFGNEVKELKYSKPTLFVLFNEPTIFDGGRNPADVGDFIAGTSSLVQGLVRDIAELWVQSGH